MTQPGRYQLKDVLDSLKITQRQLLEHKVARDAVSSVDDLQPNLIRRAELARRSAIYLMPTSTELAI